MRITMTLSAQCVASPWATTSRSRGESRVETSGVGQGRPPGRLPCVAVRAGASGRRRMRAHWTRDRPPSIRCILRKRRGEIPNQRLKARTKALGSE